MFYFSHRSICLILSRQSRSYLRKPSTQYLDPRMCCLTVSLGTPNVSVENHYQLPKTTSNNSSLTKRDVEKQPIYKGVEVNAATCRCLVPAPKRVQSLWAILYGAPCSNGHANQSLLRLDFVTAAYCTLRKEERSKEIHTSLQLKFSCYENLSKNTI